MYLAHLLTLIQLVISIPLNDQLINSGGSLPHSKDGNSVNSPETLYLPLSPSWTYFYFTNVGSYGEAGNPLQPTIFVPGPSYGNKCLQIADLYCAGDQFSLYAGFGLQTIVANSSVSGAVSCTLTSTNPNDTLINPLWSNLYYDFTVSSPIPLLLTVYVTASPFSAGKAAIRILHQSCT